MRTRPAKARQKLVTPPFVCAQILCHAVPLATLLQSGRSAKSSPRWACIRAAVQGG